MTWHIPDLVVIAAGGLIAVLSVWCAWLEEQECYQQPYERAAFGPVLFDAYRACSIMGATSVCVGLANLALPIVSHEQIPAGVSCSIKAGVLFFLGVRLHAYHYPERHAFQINQ